MAKMDIKKDHKNVLMARREVHISTDAEKTPSFAEASKMVSEHFKAPEEHIMVENVYGKYGSRTFLIKASIYDSKELKDESVKRLIKPKKVAAAA
jgi:ribosomal protein S24E